MHTQAAARTGEIVPIPSDRGDSNLQARWYDPESGTFLSVDPVVADAADPQSYNAYAYARNNPIYFTDPTGMSPYPELWNCNRCSGFYSPGYSVDLNGQIHTNAQIAQAQYAEARETGNFATPADVFSGLGDLIDFLSPGEGVPTDLVNVRDLAEITELTFVPEDVLAGSSSYWGNLGIEVLGWGLIVFDIANSIVSPTPDAGILGASMIAGRRAVAGTGRKAGQAFKARVRPGQPGPPQKLAPVKKSDALKESSRSGRHGGVITSKTQARKAGGRMDPAHVEGGLPHGHVPRRTGHAWYVE